MGQRPRAGTLDLAERELQENVIQTARIFGWRVAHFRPALTKHGWRTAVAADGAGFPDLVLVRDRVLFVELKGARGRVSSEQRVWLEALVDADAEVEIWTPADWESGHIEQALQHRR